MPAVKKPWQKPPKSMFLQSIKHANNLEITKWRADWIPLDLISASEEKWADDELVELMSRTPWKVPPIIVQPLGDEGLVILDGNHRYEAAQRLGLPGLWAVVVLEGKYLL